MADTNGTNVEADGYYGESKVDEGELDLSFLDDDKGEDKDQ